MDKKICKHNNLEKINDTIFICQNCSLIRKIKIKNNNNDNVKEKLLLSKNDYYNIKNEISIIHSTKTAINFYNDYIINSNNNETKDIFSNNSSLYLKFRKKLINHIYNLCSEINSSYECYYLSILLLDIIIHKLNYVITNYQLDLFSTICFIISKKFVEKDKMKSEKYNTYLTICHSPQKFISTKDLFLSEIECLKILKYRLNIPSAYIIMKYMFICGIIFENEIDINEYSNIYDECLNLLSICNNTNEIGFYYNPAIISFSIIYLVRKKYKLKFIDTIDLFSLFDIKYNHIKECVKLITQIYPEKSNEKINNSIDNKFKMNKSYSYTKIRIEKKEKKRTLTPNKYINFNFYKNYWIMSMKDLNNEKNWMKEDKCFFRICKRKSKLYNYFFQNSCSYSNIPTYSTNGNDLLNKKENIFRNI